MKAKQQQRIFLSRSLKPDSPFHKLAEQGHEVTATSLIKISFIDFIIPEDFNAVFFYSQKAIKHFLKSCTYDKHINYGVMGKASAALFQSITGARANVIGQGNNLSLAKELNEKWKGKQVVFPQAQRSLKSLESHLSDVNIKNLIVYNNEVNKEVELGDFDVLAFTSPLNVEAYLTKKGVTDQHVFAIGATTAAAVDKLAGVKVKYCEEPSEQRLYELVLSSL